MKEIIYIILKITECKIQKHRSNMPMKEHKKTMKISTKC